jgi:hypothetical protein
MKESALELINARPVGNVPLCCKPSVGEEVASFEPLACIGANVPLLFLLVPDYGVHEGGEDGILPQVPLLRDVLKILS